MFIGARRTTMLSLIGLAATANALNLRSLAAGKVDCRAGPEIPQALMKDVCAAGMDSFMDENPTAAQMEESLTKVCVADCADAFGEFMTNAQNFGINCQGPAAKKQGGNHRWLFDASAPILEHILQLGALDDIKGKINDAASDTKKKVKDTASSTKKKINDAADDTKKKINDAADDTKKKVNDAAADTKKKVNNAAEDAKKKVSGKKDDAEEKKDNNRVLGALDDIKGKVNDAASDAKKKVNDVAADTKKKVNDVAADTKKKVGDAADDTKKKVGDAVDDTKKKVGDAADDTKKKVDEATANVTGANDDKDNKKEPAVVEQEEAAEAAAAAATTATAEEPEVNVAHGYPGLGQGCQKDEAGKFCGALDIGAGSCDFWTSCCFGEFVKSVGKPIIPERLAMLEKKCPGAQAASAKACAATA